MNVTYIIGNGFDLNLGLMTSYKHFYNYYLGQKPRDEVEAKDEKEMAIVKMKQSIKDYLKNEKGEVVKAEEANWADLELALGQYTKEVETVELMIDLLRDIRKELTGYFEETVEQIQISETADNSLLAIEFGSVTDFLKKADQKKLIADYANHSSPIWIDIITLNYTTTIEKLLNIQGKDGEFKKIKVKNFLGKEAFLQGIHHLHHTISDGLILGVNDESQIANEKFRENPDLGDFLIKPVSNRMFGTEIDEDCKQIIQSSELLVLFGVSIGATDQDWWKLITFHLLRRSDSKLIIFVYDESFIFGDPTLGKRERQIIQDFLSHSKLSDDNRDYVARKIAVAFNTPLFHGLRKLINIRPYIKGADTFDYSNNDGRDIIGTGKRSFTTEWSKAGKEAIHAYNHPEDIDAIGLLNNQTDLGTLNIEDLDSVDFSSRTRRAQVNDVVIWKNKEGHFAATKVVEIKTREDDGIDELKIEYMIY